MFKTVSNSFKNSLKNDEEMTLDANIGNYKMKIRA